MASHEHLRFILKTPKGYLTQSGTAEDICDKNIIVLNFLDIGGFRLTKDKTVQRFFKYSSVNFDISECDVLSYSCPTKGYYDCCKCPNNDYCDFWHNRTACKIS